MLWIRHLNLTSHSPVSIYIRSAIETCSSGSGPLTASGAEVYLADKISITFTPFPMPRLSTLLHMGPQVSRYGR